jgi:hypothetical protein
VPILHRGRWLSRIGSRDAAAAPLLQKDALPCQLLNGLGWYLIALTGQ